MLIEKPFNSVQYVKKNMDMYHKKLGRQCTERFKSGLRYAKKIWKCKKKIWQTNFL